jgi:type II restriction/modification system DNA methylase subunit YeeA
LQHPPPRVSVKQLRGIEIERYAAELARVTLWIGDLQWLKQNGYLPDRRPILDSLDQIEERDALLDRSKGAEPKDWPEAEWPETDVIIGNPPFVGAKLMLRQLGESYTGRVRHVYDGLPAFTDFVCYWFDKSRQHILAGKATRAGLVATKAIAKNTNLPVMQAIVRDLNIFEAFSNEPWALQGAAVRVALICFEPASANIAKLNGSIVERINPDLTTGLDVTPAKAMRENRSASGLGIQNSGPLDIPGDQARLWLQMPSNPNGRSNSDALRPYANGDDVVSRSRDFWEIDFPAGLSEAEASLYSAPFQYLKSARYVPGPGEPEVNFAEYRASTPSQNSNWWEPHRARADMRAKIAAFERYLVTPETSEHRVFAWLKPPMLADKSLIVICRDDDAAFGILQSRVHEAWATRIGNRMGQGNQRRYNSSFIFETFPFPEGLTPNLPASQYANDPRAIAIAEAARALNEKREAWLNPPECVDRVPEVVPGYPDRIVPKNEAAAKELKNRTLTKLYNERPAWLDHLHKCLDKAVAAAYGWPANLSDEEILERLFALNQERAAAGR